MGATATDQPIQPHVAGDPTSGAADSPPPTSELPGVARERAIGAVHDDIAITCGHLNAQHGRLVTTVADVLERNLWAQAGIRSPEHWLSWQTGTSHANARRLVAAARRVHELPRTIGALVAGELSLDQISPIVERAPAWADGQACELARSMTVQQIRVAVGRYPFEPDRAPEAETETETDDATSGVEPDESRQSGGSGETGEPHRSGEPGGTSQPDGSEPAGEPGHTTDQHAHPHREPDDPHEPADPHRDPGLDDPGVDAADPERCSFTQGDDGRWNLHGRFDADHGAIIDAALREISDRLFAETGRRPTRAECLVHLARLHLDNVGEPTRRARYRVHFHLDERHQLVDPHGFALPRWLRDFICCDPDLSITWQRHGTPIARGSTSPTIDPAVRRHVLRRDGCCRIPGCRSKRVDLHHLVERQHGGCNDPENLIALCPYHHRLHHRGELVVSGDAEAPDGLTITDRHGRPWRPNALVRPPTAAPPPPSGTYRHPLGERLQTRWIHFSPPPRPPIDE